MVLRATRGDAVVLVLTAVATVAFDLIVAVEIGVAVAALLALRAVAAQRARGRGTESQRVRRRRRPTTRTRCSSEHILTYRLDGALFFGAAHASSPSSPRSPACRSSSFGSPELQVLDATGAQALGEIVSQLEARGITVLIKGPRPEHLRVLEAVGGSTGSHTSATCSTISTTPIAHACRHVVRTARDAA